MGKINWSAIVEESRELCRSHKTETGVYPSLRGLFYMLVSRELIPNTKQAYKSLSKVLAQKRYRGEFNWYFLHDGSRRSDKLEPYDYSPTPQDEDDLLRSIRDLVKDAGRFNVNAWLDQKYRLVIVVEKDAVYDVVKNALSAVFDSGIFSFRLMRGYSSATDLFKLREELDRIESDQTPVVLVISDYDPSGEDLARDYHDRLARIYDGEVIFEKIAVTLEQIERLELPHRPDDADEIAKMRRDPRFKNWEHGLFRVELDALVTLQFEEFKRVLSEAINRYWSQADYDTLTKLKVERLKQEAQEARESTLESLTSLLEDTSRILEGLGD